MFNFSTLFACPTALGTLPATGDFILRIALALGVIVVIALIVFIAAKKARNK
ncbi:MAG: LPXTG cell wall anchor domain-containing protein [Eggerthellaceae bacterium]|nr:LPXTG cell wall anchor domain-containing protein [Eggerthellaceae bacterium]